MNLKQKRKQPTQNRQLRNKDFINSRIATGIQNDQTSFGSVGRFGGLSFCERRGTGFQSVRSGSSIQQQPGGACHCSQKVRSITNVFLCRGFSISLWQCYVSQSIMSKTYLQLISCQSTPKMYLFTEQHCNCYYYYYDDETPTQLVYVLMQI